VLVDDSPASFALQPRNGVWISTFVPRCAQGIDEWEVPPVLKRAAAYDDTKLQTLLIHLHELSKLHSDVRRASFGPAGRQRRRTLAAYGAGDGAELPPLRRNIETSDIQASGGKKIGVGRRPRRPGIVTTCDGRPAEADAAAGLGLTEKIGSIRAMPQVPDYKHVNRSPGRAACARAAALGADAAAAAATAAAWARLLTVSNRFHAAATAASKPENDGEERKEDV
jgi:hypothetical protein